MEGERGAGRGEKGCEKKVRKGVGGDGVCILGGEGGGVGGDGDHGII